MHRRLLLAFLLGGAGCSLFLDTGGLDEPPAAEPDASTTADTSTPPTGDATANPDVVTGTDAALPDAADAGIDVMSALVGDWPFDEGSGNVFLDKSGRSHNGILANALWGTDRNGDDNQAVVFSGDGGSHASVAGHPDFDRTTTTSFTMALWTRFDETPSHDIVFSVLYGTTNAAFGIELMDATTLTYFDGKEHIAQAVVPSVVGAWHHFGIVVEGSQARLYFDGVRVSQGAADTTPRTSTQVFFGHSNWGDYLRGGVDRARFFRVALTDAQMMTEKNR